MSTTGRAPALAMPAGEGDGVALADADVEELLGEVVADLLELVPLAHGGGEDGDPRVAARRRRTGRSLTASV